MLDQISVGITLLIGFLWLRSQARGLPNPDDNRKAQFAIFFCLAPMLIGEKWLFDRLAFSPEINLTIKLSSLVATFVLIRLVFIRTRKITS